MDIKSIVNAKTLGTVAGVMAAKEYLLDKVGLQRRPSTMSMVGNAVLLFSAGAAVGAGVALLLAPKSGTELRSDLSTKAGELKGRIARKNGEQQEQVSTFSTEQTYG